MGMKSVTAGNKAQDTFKELMMRRKAFVHRLPDPSDVAMIAGRRVKLPAQPADFVVCWKGEMFYAEIKSSANNTVFPLAGIRQSQRASAKETTLQNCIYIFYIYSAYNDLWYEVQAQFILDLIMNGSKSIPWKDLDNFIFDIGE